MNGTIKTVKADSGYGFIKAGDGKEYFFHMSALSSKEEFQQLREGQRVSFELGESPKGPRAEHVTAV